ncbi:MAG TPA: LysR substrate-binding domain-containing protein [Limnobacter sp.]|nr:LysR substrate-binding domain-containing protein [Limnobacter sp.]
MDDTNPDLLRVRIPSTAELLAFEAVARLRSFSRAAEDLSVTQSAISHRIGQLEGHLGVNLFLRLGQTIELTPHGAQFLPHVRRGLRELQEGLVMAQQTTQRRVKLSLPPSMASHLLAQHLSVFQREHPDIDLEIAVTSNYQNLKSGEGDLGIRMGLGDWEGLVSAHLLDVNLIAVCSPQYMKAHPWLKQPQSLSKATLLRQRVFPWRPWLECAGIDLAEPDRGPYFSEVSLMIEAAELSQGVALVPEVLVSRHLAKGSLVPVLNVALKLDKGYYVSASPHALNRPEVKALFDWLLQNLTTHRSAATN